MNTQLVLSALADDTRNQILNLVREKPRCLSELALALGIGIPSVLFAVTKLERAELVRTRRKGRKRLVTSCFWAIELTFHTRG